MLLVTIASAAANLALGFLLVRAARRLLQFDSIWTQIMPVLFEYGEDLRKMVSADLLVDNPEVLAFHRRNLRTLGELDAITRSVSSVAAKRDKKAALPRPDME